jgi:hypothetical protein
MAAVNGLCISGSVVINKLSGPVSIFILQPNYDSQYVKQYKNAPIFILLGDIHGSDANLCKPADNATRIYDRNFLIMMCNILNSNEVIDFCIEGTDLTKQTTVSNPSEQPIMAFFNLIKTCNRLKLENAKDYPFIEKIRWQYTDIRFWTLDMPEVQQVRQDRPRKYYCLSEFLFLRIENNPNYIKKPNAETFNKLFIYYAEELKAKGYSLEANIAVNAREIYSKFVENRFSLINFQILKITKMVDRQFLKQKIQLYIEYMYKKELDALKCKPEQLGILIRDMHNKIVKFFNKGNIEESKEIYGTPNYNIYKNFILRIECIKLDMFTFAKSFTRMLNPAPDSQPPIINICYFGNIHIQNMHYFITKILNVGEYKQKDAYIEVVKKGIDVNDTNPSPKMANRCLDFSNGLTQVSLRELLVTLRTKRLLK